MLESVMYPLVAVPRFAESWLALDSIDVWHVPNLIGKGKINKSGCQSQSDFYAFDRTLIPEMVVLLTLTVGATSVNDEPETILVAFVDNLTTNDWAVSAVVFTETAGSAPDRTAKLSAKKGVASNMAI
jgi:hypothetical protein